MTTPPGPPASASPDDPALIQLVHDLRGCIAPLMNALEVIRMAAGDNPVVASALQIADRQARTLTEMVAGVLRPPTGPSRPA